ncbi:MAG: MerR family transcriptional regulator [Geobacteraceae bacterium]|nr:MerR family transcriptional regulator [Geobacteraceae bacterium]
MTLGITWCGIEEAAAKYSLDVSLILKWVEEGVVRAEQVGKRVVRVHVDDLELKMQERSGF